MIVNKCFLHCRSGSAVVSKGSGSSVQVNKTEMHGCSYAGAAAFDGGHICVYDSCSRWSQFSGFAATGSGTSMKIIRSISSDCGSHGFYAMHGGSIQAISCSASRNNFGGFVAYGSGSKISVESCFALKNRHTGCGAYYSGCLSIKSCNLDKNDDAALHLVGPRSSAIVLRSNLNNNRVGVFLQSGAFANILESKISHNRESGVVVRGIGSVVFIHCCNVQYNQVHGCVAEEGARVRACKCDFNNNAVSSLSSTDPHSELTVANTTMKQSGRGLLISNGGTAEARECHFEFNEYAGVAVQDPGSKLMMHNCHVLRNVLGAYATSWGTIECIACKIPPRRDITCNETDYLVSDHGALYTGEGFGLISI